MRKIFLVSIEHKEFIYVERGKNQFLFTNNELNKARKRYEKNKTIVLIHKKLIEKSRVK